MGCGCNSGMVKLMRLDIKPPSIIKPTVSNRMGRNEKIIIAKRISKIIKKKNN